MSASASVLQLIRAHYGGHEDTFAASAMALARGSKVWSVRNGIEQLVREGLRSRAAQVRQQQGHSMRQIDGDRPRQLAGGMLEQLKRQTFEQLLLPAETQAFFDEISTEIEYGEELAERGLRPRNRLLLHGPPGCGKTSCASALASALDLPAYGVALPRLIGKYLGETGANLGALFDSIPDDSLLVFDELDAIGGVRGGIEQAAGKEFNSTLNTMLTLLDRKSTGILIATTNRLDILDPALVRRFDESVLVPEPTAGQKLMLAERLCEQFGVPVPGVGECQNYDAVTKLVLREARKHVMREILAQEGQQYDEQENDRGPDPAAN
jgi:SpoVK/Ycf46/Vps4 family AAA+-type ATPase